MDSSIAPLPTGQVHFLPLRFPPRLVYKWTKPQRPRQKFSCQRANNGVQHVRERNPFVPLLLDPKHLVEVVLPHAGAVHGQKGSKAGQGNLKSNHAHHIILASFSLWTKCRLVFTKNLQSAERGLSGPGPLLLDTSPLPAGSSTLQHSLAKTSRSSIYKSTTF